MLEEVFKYARTRMTKEQFSRFENKVITDLYNFEKTNTPGERWLSLPVVRTINCQKYTTAKGVINT